MIERTILGPIAISRHYSKKMPGGGRPPPLKLWKRHSKRKEKQSKQAKSSIDLLRQTNKSKPMGVIPSSPFLVTNLPHAPHHPPPRKFSSFHRHWVLHGLALLWFGLNCAKWEAFEAWQKLKSHHPVLAYVTIWRFRLKNGLQGAGYPHKKPHEFWPISVCQSLWTSLLIFVDVSLYQGQCFALLAKLGRSWGMLKELVNHGTMVVLPQKMSDVIRCVR